MPTSDSSNRRRQERKKIPVPVEIQTATSESPIRGATTDLSLSGCYVATIFPFPVGTPVDLKLSISTPVLIEAMVVTSDPQVGNGIRFNTMLAEDRDALKTFLEAAENAEGSEFTLI
jgi:hypothetical protein